MSGVVTLKISSKDELTAKIDELVKGKSSLSTYYETIQTIYLDKDQVTIPPTFQTMRIFGESVDLQVKKKRDGYQMVIISDNDADLGYHYLPLTKTDNRSYFWGKNNEKLYLSYYSSETQGEFIRWKGVK